MAERGRSFAPTLLAACLAGLAGCAGVVRGPDPLVGGSPAPAAPPAAAKPPSLSLFAGIDPLAARVDVRPADVVLPTRGEQVLIAAVTDAAGRPLPGRRVEWTLDGPGAITAVDDRGRLFFRGERTNDHAAVSYTEHFDRTVSRGAPAPDFAVGRGQSWCVVTSAVEGETRVTASAPEVGDRAGNRITVTQHWADVVLTAPPASAGSPGVEQFLSAAVSRRADRQPLAGYSVRFRILGGPPAVFLPSQTGDAVVVSGSSGVAPVVLSETAAQPGRTTIGVELLGRDGAVVGRGETLADWQGPDVSLSAAFPPSAEVGREAPLTLTLTNAGAADAKLLTVRAAVPDGCTYLRSNPPAFVQGNELVWTLAAVPGRGRRTLQAVFQTARAGPVTARASLTTDGGRPDEKTALCAVTPPKAPDLKVWPSGPETGLVGGKVVYQVTVRNQGTGPATNVVLKAAFDGGLEHAEGGAERELTVGTLAAGESRTVALPALPKKAGAATARVTVLGDGKAAAQAERPLTVRDARLTLRLTGPGRAYAGRPAVWQLEVRNAGDAPVGAITVSDLLSPGLAFVEASDGGRLQGNQVVWSLGDLPPGGQKVLRLTTASPRPAPRAALTATAVGRVSGDAAAEVRVQAGAETAVLGLPGYKMTVEDHDDPVEVGAQTAYRITVRNTGTLPGDRVQVAAAMPPQMRLVTASGPATYKADGGRVTFTPVDALAPGQTLTYIVQVEAVKPGEARFRAELTTATMREPLVKEESTNVR